MNKTNTTSAQKVVEAKVPTDLAKALASALKAKATWNELTPIARRDFVSWVDEAKQEETRTRRIKRTCEMLVAGKRRPCCYSIVPMNLYKVLGTTPKAKAVWSDLTPTERRDFTSWINGAKESETHKLRVEKTIGMLSAGKRRP